MSENTTLTGKPSVDRPWMKFYPPIMMQMISLPKCTLSDYLNKYCPGMDVAAIDYYGEEILWQEIFFQAEQTAKSMKAIGIKEGDQVPAYLRLVPEFIPLLLAAEKIGASILCRDNTPVENAEAAGKAGAKVIFVHDFLSMEEYELFRKAGVEKIVCLSPLERGKREAMPAHVQACLDSYYPEVKAPAEEMISWKAFLEMGNSFKEPVYAKTDINRPLYRCYTSGSTGPSKQVIHSADTMLSIVCQMNFYGGSDEFRPNWLVTCLPPSLVAVVVSMVLLPMASNKLLIMDPFVFETDVDLEVMRYKANNWPQLPLFADVMVHSKRIPRDYDMSHLLAGGAGSESINNHQLKAAQTFYTSHGCKFRYTTGYGCSEAGSNVSMPMSPKPLGNGNVGVPLPLSVMSIFKPGTQEELGYNQIGEICKTGPGNMLGYDNLAATEKALQLHADGNVWLHLGDLGYMDEDGVMYTVGRGDNPRFGGGYLNIQMMENMIADAEIEGIDDEFFVNIEDDENEGFFLPYMYVVLHDGYTVDDIREKVYAALKPHQKPVEIFAIEKRPFWHFKTNRIGLGNEIKAMRAAAKQA